MDRLIINEVVEQLEALPHELQYRVLEFASSLADSLPHGVPGPQLLSFAGAIPPDDLQRMRQAVELGCEQSD